MMQALTRRVRSVLTGPGASYVFRRADRPELAAVERAHLYVHVPFCENVCPYCPYYKEPYDPARAQKFVDALFREIDLYEQALGGLTVLSVYVGGGTPTLLGRQLTAVLDRLREAFDVTGPTAVETNPADVSPQTVAMLRGAGVRLVSVGVQSFQDRVLRFIGRPYAAEGLPERVAEVMAGGFDTVNLDLMFALPGQTPDELAADLEAAVATGADQITAYPLFTFPYTAVGRQLRLAHVRMPDLRTRREHYYHLNCVLADAGYRRVSVWGFQRDGAPRYSSVTRDVYIGLGPGAGSHLAGEFCFNTFSLDAYVERLGEGRFPTALRMPMTEAMENWHWLYWRLYDTVVPKAGLRQRFARDDARLRSFLGFLRLAGMTRERDGELRLTLRGAFWVHWLQNQFILPYIDRMWRAATAEPFPEEVRL